MNVYRYRSCDARNKEDLKNSVIYFANLSELNDPMEGFIDIYFKGDHVIWRNLFRNYIRSLFYEYLWQNISLELTNDIYIPQWHDDFFQRISNNDWFYDLPSMFLKEDRISSLIDFSQGKEIRKNELLTYLRVIHITAIRNVIVYAKECKLVGEIQMSMLEDVFPGKNIDWNMFWGGSKEKAIIEILSEHFSNVISLNAPPSNAKKFSFDFPYLFINKLEELIYPDFYTASFSLDPNNSSMWGNYADSHKGICLIFKDDKELPVSSLNEAKDKWTRYKFYNVEYKNDIVSINFFENIANVAMGIWNQIWGADYETGEISIIKPMDDNNRDKYWETRYKTINRKTQDWEYERETRLLLSNLFREFSKPESRKLKYDFNYLTGIIFGMRISDSDKREIIEIISQKCKATNRKEFKFFQSYYNKTKVGMDFKEINALSINEI